MMPYYIWHNITLFELLDLLVVIAGTILELRYLRYAWRRYQVILVSGTNGTLKKAASIFLIIHGGKLVFLMLCMIALLIAMPHRNASGWTLSGAIINMILLLAIVTVIGIGTLIGWLERMIAK